MCVHMPWRSAVCFRLALAVKGSVWLFNAPSFSFSRHPDTSTSACRAAHICTCAEDKDGSFSTRGRLRIEIRKNKDPRGVIRKVIRKAEKCTTKYTTYKCCICLYSMFSGGKKGKEHLRCELHTHLAVHSVSTFAFLSFSFLFFWGYECQKWSFTIQCEQKRSDKNCPWNPPIF